MAGGKHIEERIWSLLSDMRDLHVVASSGASHKVLLHMQALDHAEEAAQIVKEIEMDEAGDAAAEVGYQIEEILKEMLAQIPTTSQGWSRHAMFVGTLEYLHYELVQIREEMQAIGLLRSE